MFGYYKRVGRLMWKDFRSSVGEQIFGVVIAVAIFIFQAHYGLIKKEDIRVNLWSIGLPYVILVVGLFMWHLVRAPWELHRHLEAATAKLTQDLQQEKAKNQKPDIHIKVLEGLVLSFDRDRATGRSIIGTFSKEVGLCLSLENHRPVTTTIQDVLLRLRANGRLYDCRDSNNGNNQKFVITQSGEGKEMFGLDMEPLEYANHDYGWMIFKLEGLEMNSNLDAEAELTVIDGLGNSHISGIQKVRLLPARYNP
jgi:hypothetical protein